MNRAQGITIGRSTAQRHRVRLVALDEEGTEGERGLSGLVCPEAAE